MTGVETGLVGAIVALVSMGTGLIWGNNNKVKKTECEKTHEVLNKYFDEKLTLTLKPLIETMERIEKKVCN